MRITPMSFVLPLVVVSCLATSIGQCEEKKEEADTAATPEELVQASDKKISVSGTFRLNQQALRDPKPLPKVIGLISAQNGAYQVMVRDTTTMGQLAMRNGKKVIVSGLWANAGEQGLFLLAESLIEADVPMPARRKRGGL